MNKIKLAEINISVELERIENAANIIIRESVKMSPNLKNKYVKKINKFALNIREDNRQSAYYLHKYQNENDGEKP